MKKKLFILLTSLLVVSCNNVQLVSYTYSCNSISLPEYKEIVSPLDTSVSFKTLNIDKRDELKDQFESIIDNLHYEVDPYHNFKDINGVKTINDTDGKVKVSSSLITLLKTGVELEKLSEGKFNILMGSLIDLWKDKFANASSLNTDPDINDINHALKNIPTYKEIDDYLIIDEENSSVELKKKNNDSTFPTKINLGAIAKGYALTLTTPLFNDYPAIINCGSSSIAVTNNYPVDHNYYTITLREPLRDSLDETETLFSVKIDPYTNISVSGDEQRYFYFIKDGQKIYRNHILDPETGFSTNYHAQVFLYSKINGEVLDALSTVLMNVLEIKDIESMINKIKTTYSSDIEYAVIDRLDNRKYQVTYSNNFKNNLLSKSVRIV